MATTWFFYYLYFYARDKFGFDTLHNFLLAAGLGLSYGVVSLGAGRFAQKSGYFAAFRLGACLLLAGLLLCAQATGVWAVLLLAWLANIGMCFTWPALEGLMSEGESPARLRTLVGIYNITWAVTAAFAFFTGGAMQKGWGTASMFYVPAAMVAVEIVFAIWLEDRVNRQPGAAEVKKGLEAGPEHEHPTSPVAPKVFLSMALLANPFAYLSINTIIPTLPALAERLNLTKASAGVVCSVWMFSRAVAFLVLWLWPKWHYRFRFLAAGFSSMILSFCLMLLTHSLWVLVLAQVLLGAAFGLMYHSSLFYSMDVGETKGEHGGIHEAAIGAGNFGGPAIAALALALFPAQPHSGILAVGMLLLGGLGGLFWLRYRKTGA